jgi:queuine tRNA-ribosyltransferase
MLGPTLLSIHNLTYYQRLMAEARAAIEQDRFQMLLDHHRTLWAAGESTGPEPTNSTAAPSN